MYQIKALISVFLVLIRLSTKLEVDVLENQLSIEAFLSTFPPYNIILQLPYDRETHGARRGSNLDPLYPQAQVSIKSLFPPLSPYLLGARGGKGGVIQIHQF